MKMILIISHSDDYYNVDLFQAYCESKKIKTFRLNSDCINHLQQITISENNNFELISEDNIHLNSEEINAVWHRKSWKITVPEDLHNDFHPIFFQEYETLRNNIFSCLKNVPWINDLRSELFVEQNKVYQLQVAKKFDIKIPKTIFTNNPENVKTFIRENCRGKAVAKLHGSLKKSMSGIHTLPTLFLDNKNMETIDDIIYTPMIIQPYIEKEYEIRLMFVDGHFFTGKINNSENVDWRIAQDYYFWEKYSIPQYLKTKISKMMKHLNLICGAMDLIKSKDGSYYFLEVNPQGEWGMLQKELGYPIAETIAEVLIKRINNE